jgi:hypothetical protein
MSPRNLDAMVACFADDVMSGQSTHRGDFRGSEHVRRKWTQIFAGLPNLGACATDRSSYGTCPLTARDGRARREMWQVLRPRS